MDKRLCIFCGERPPKKTREHVLSRALIEATGTLSRVWTFTLFSIPSMYREISLNSFVFPACKHCNEEFGKLEGAVLPILRALDAREPITVSESFLLLDWLDKVRVGLWLGHLTLSDDRVGVVPKFRIADRIARKDRVVLVFPHKQQKGMNLFGPQFPFFYYQPSCFGLRVNGAYFINASSDFLLAKTLGLPFPSKTRSRRSGETEIIDMRCRHPSGKSQVFNLMPKPSLAFGQCISNSLLRSQFPAEYERAASRVPLDMNSFGTHTPIFDFLRGRWLDSYETIPFGGIALEEAVEFWKIVEATLSVQDWLFRNGALTRRMKPVEQLNRRMKRDFVEALKKSPKNENS